MFDDDKTTQESLVWVIVWSKIIHIQVINHLIELKSKLFRVFVFFD